MSEAANYLVISSIQDNGKKFRPADWIERISSAFASLDASNRLHYSSNVQPCMIEGEKCLLVARGLEQSNPRAYEFVMGFARSNKLRIRLDRRLGSRALSRMLPCLTPASSPAGL